MNVQTIATLRPIDRRQFTQMCAGSLALAAVSCGRREGRAYARGATVTVAYDSDALRPAVDNSAKFLVFLPLVARDARGVVEGRLAQRWEHSGDYREWTFHLRTDVRWHDGVPVTAADIKFTIDLWKHSDVAWDAAGAIESASARDDSTITIRYTEPTDALDPWEVYYPKHRLQDLDPTQFNAWTFWTRPVGNGPYRFVRSLPETMMEFEANPDFYRGKPRIARVRLKFAGPGLTSLLSGEVDALTEPGPAEIPKVAADPRLRVYHWYVAGAAWALFWKHDHPVLGDARVRRAFTLAVNRRELAQALDLPESIPVVDGPFTMGQLQRRALPEPLPYAPAQARALLDEAGWAHHDGDGARERQGRPLRFTATVSPYSAFEKMAVYVQEQLRRVGARMDIERVNHGILLERRDSGRFEALFSFVSSRSRWLERYFARDSVGYRNASVSDLLHRAANTPDPVVQDRVYWELAKVFRTDVPITFFFPRVEYVFVHRRLRGLSSPWHADPVHYMEDLWLEDGNAR